MIGIIGALDEEIELLSSHMKNKTKQEYASFKFYSGEIENKKIVLVKSNPGKVNAATCAQILIDKFHVSSIIFIGVAGALNPELKIGDIVISKDCIQHDVDGESLGFEKGQIPFTDMRIFNADYYLIDKTILSAKKLDLQVTLGRILSGDQFINSKEKSEQLRKEFEGDCVEMEGASFAQVCLLNKIPHISIRSISDLADHSASGNFNEFCKHSADKACPLVIELIKNIKQEEFDIKSSIRTIPNHPKEGIMFRDITTLLKDPKAFKESLDILEERYQGKKIDLIAGIEARGFIFGAALADRLNVGFIPIRKKGKLPGETISEEYELEYGTDIIEIHKDAIKKGDNILIIDDLIATGGTCIAASKLIKKLGANVYECAFIIGLPDINGMKKLEEEGLKVFTLVDFEGE